ncbi:reverse transcriptase [Gossypium australe]|uniref:Reverse transcriptase n=1 Tax=Gossypium australe TaxID=47621 RepID=A0A5B6USL4_9ROSI|nr:reverse transcriptase [Gossypium australe]
METKLDKKRMEKVRKSCGLQNGIEVGAARTRGGLCLAWKDDIVVTLRSFSNWHLDVMVKEEDNQEECNDHVSRAPRDRNFHFEVWWTMEDSFEATLKDLWEASSESLMDRLKIVQIGLAKWANTIKCRKAYWEQRARVNWLRHGDRNTTYFHNCATARRRANSIYKLILDNGQEINDESIIQEEAKTYFEKLFTSKGIADPREILEGIEGNILVEINACKPLFGR